MDMGIRGRKAIVCASSQGLGLACAQALAAEGVEVWLNGRDAGRLARAAQQVSNATGATAQTVQADLGTDAGRAALVSACPQADILINNNAGPPPGQLADWDHSAWMAALESNLLAAALLMRALPVSYTHLLGEAWNAMWAPGRTPPGDMQRMRSALQKVLAAPAMRDLLMNKLACVPAFRDGAEMARLQRAELEAWEPIIRASGFKPES